MLLLIPMMMVVMMVVMMMDTLTMNIVSHCAYFLLSLVVDVVMSAQRLRVVSGFLSGT